MPSQSSVALMPHVGSLSNQNGGYAASKALHANGLGQTNGNNLPRTQWAQVARTLGKGMKFGDGTTSPLDWSFNFPSSTSTTTHHYFSS